MKEEPLESYRVVCPESGERLIPTKVWEGKGEGGKPELHGTMKKHHHRGAVCDYSNLIGKVERPGKTG